MAAKSSSSGEGIAKPTGNGSIFDNLGKTKRVNAEHLPAWRAHLCAGPVVRVKAIEHRSSYKEQMVDALASEGDEGRGKLR